MAISPLPSMLRRPALEPDHVLLLQLELDGVLDRDDPLAVGDEGGQHVEQGRLAGAGAAGDDDVQPGLDAASSSSAISGVRVPNADQVGDLERVLGELADGQRGAVERQRRDRWR